MRMLVLMGSALLLQRSVGKRAHSGKRTIPPGQRSERALRIKSMEMWIADYIVCKTAYRWQDYIDGKTT